MQVREERDLKINPSLAPLRNCGSQLWILYTKRLQANGERTDA